MPTIGIMDSGVGGLSVFREIRRLLPRENYIYYSDSAYCPYGEKDVAFIRRRCKEITRYLLSEGASVVVVACNTATAAAIRSLRREFSIPILGTEPAVKPAVKQTRTGVVGVLATAGTLGSESYLRLKERTAGGVRIVEHVGEGFVELVENGILDGPGAEECVKNSLGPLLDEGADTIVLGCTHYPFLLPAMRRLSGPETLFIEPSTALATHLVNVMEENGIGVTGALPSGVSSHPHTKLVASGSDEALKRMYGLFFQTGEQAQACSPVTCPRTSK